MCGVFYLVVPVGLGLFCCFADVCVGFCVVLFKGLVRDSPLGVCCASVLFVWFGYFVTYVGCLCVGFDLR